MTKRYATIYSNGFTQETSSAHEAVNFINYGDGQVFKLAGREVDVAEFFSAARSAVDDAWEKKNTTHKRVRVLHGNSAACYVNKWVKR